MLTVIHCPVCAESLRRAVAGPPQRYDSWARHVHVTHKLTRGGRPRFGTAGCFNRCLSCGTEYSTVACGRAERRRRRRLERHGQLRLEVMAC